MQVIFKRSDSNTEKTIDVSPNSKLDENREVAQILLSFPENPPCKLVLERTKEELKDNLTFEEAGVQDNDKLILSLPTKQKIKLPTNPPESPLPINSSTPPPSNNSPKPQNSNNWLMAIITGSVVGIFVMIAITMNNFNNNLDESKPNFTSNSPKNTRTASILQEVLREDNIEQQTQSQRLLEAQLKETQKKLEEAQRRQKAAEIAQEKIKQPQQVENRDIQESYTSFPKISRDKAIDKLADSIFYGRYPELRGRKIRPGEVQLGKEWSMIRKCDAEVDYIFYQRYPELRGRKIRSEEATLTNEWLSIKRSIWGCS